MASTPTTDHDGSGRPASERVTGAAADLHAWGPAPDTPLLVRHCIVDAPALVLGSTQTADLVDHDAADALGVAVAGRRSGGGAVLLRPGEHLWVDVVVPAGDPRWRDDVTLASIEIGTAWATALEPLLPVGPAPTSLELHRGGADREGVGRLICAAGRGPGEVLAGEAKLVGISQRRTRHWARFQCLVHRRFRADEHERLLGPDAAGIGPRVALLDEAVTDETVLTALVAALS